MPRLKRQCSRPEIGVAEDWTVVGAAADLWDRGTPEFRVDVVRVARNREQGQRLADIAKDFGISETYLSANGWALRRDQTMKEVEREGTARKLGHQRFARPLEAGLNPMESFYGGAF